MSDAPVEIVTLEHDGFAVDVAPERGASLSRLDWRHPDGDARPLFRRADPADVADRGGSLSKLGHFLMLPFANRIDAARFEFEGETVTMPLNRPEQACAIHGFSRARPWRVTERSASRVVLEDRYTPGETLYDYRAWIEIEIAGGAVALGVGVENCGKRLPYGFGLHPWLPADDETTLRFDAETTFAPDERTFPIAAEAPSAETGWREATPIRARLGLDRAYAGWSGAAEIRHPRAGYALGVTGEDAFARNVHIYCAPDRPFWCVEPVTHVTDVVNRRDFAPYGDMSVLDEGDRLFGRARFRPTPL